MAALDVYNLFWQVSDEDKEKVIEILDNATKKILKICDDDEIRNHLDDLEIFCKALNKNSKYVQINTES